MLDDKGKRYGIIAWRPAIRFYRGALACAMDVTSARGIDDLRAAVAEFLAMNHMVRFPYYKAVLADELAKRGRLDEGEETILGALAAVESQNEGWCAPELLRIHASILMALGRTDEAETVLLKSLAAAAEIGALSWRLRTANDLASLWCDTSRADEARDLLRPIHARFDEGFATRDLGVAAKLLASL
ncbi:MAG: hypothetical protein ABW217_11650 [Polyangiaceae bacterium]